VNTYTSIIRLFVLRNCWRMLQRRLPE